MFPKSRKAASGGTTKGTLSRTSKPLDDAETTSAPVGVPSANAAIATTDFMTPSVLQQSMRVLDCAVQNGLDLGRDLLDRSHAVDAADEMLGFVERQDGSSFGAIFLHPRPDSLLIVVGASLELGGPADVADSRRFRRPKAVVVTGTAPGAGEAAGDALHQCFLVDREFDDVVELAATFAEQDFERFRLVLGSRETVEDCSPIS